MKKQIILFLVVFTFTSCDVKTKLLRYTGVSNSDRIGVSEQVENVQNVDDAVVIHSIAETSIKTSQDVPVVVDVPKEDGIEIPTITTQHESTELTNKSDVESVQNESVVNQPVVIVPEIKSDENYIFLVYLIGGLLIVWVIVRILIKHKK